MMAGVCVCVLVQLNRRFWLNRFISKIADASGWSLYAIDTPLIHGCSSAWAALNRSWGTTFNSLRIKSLPSSEIFVQYGAGNSSTPDRIFSYTDSKLDSSSMKGGNPQSLFERKRKKKKRLSVHLARAQERKWESP